MAHAVIVGAVRTAVGKKGGALAGVRPDDLLADTLKALVERVEHVELLECTSCGQVTTGTLCAFCKLAERVKGHGSDPASTRR